MATPLVSDAVRRSAERARLGLADQSDLQVLSSHGSEDQKKVADKLKKAAQARDDVAAAEERREQALTPATHPGLPAYRAEQIQEKQTASMDRLRTQIFSGQIERPLGKRLDSQSVWKPVVSDTGEQVLERKIVSAQTGAAVVDRTTGKEVVDQRTVQQVNKLEVQKIVAKAVGLPLSEKGIKGHARTEMVRGVVDQAITIAETGKQPEGDSAADKAALAVSERIADILTGEGTVDMKAMQDAFVAMADAMAPALEPSGISL